MRPDLREIRISSITVGENVRAENLEVDDLVESIRRHGVLQPILVRRTGAGLELVSGHRRLKACRILGRERIPAVVQDVRDSDRTVLQLTENVQRQDLEPYELARVLRELCDRSSPNEVAERCGKSIAWVWSYLTYKAVYDDLIECGVEAERLKDMSVWALVEMHRLTRPERMELLERLSGNNTERVTQRMVTTAIRSLRSNGRSHGARNPGEHNTEFTVTVHANTVILAFEGKRNLRRVVQLLLAHGGRKA